MFRLRRAWGDRAVRGASLPYGEKPALDVMASGFRREQRQRTTKFDPFSGEKPAHGHMIFAERCQVESEEWWKEHALMVELVVQCTPARTTFNYPPSAANSQADHVRVDPRSERFRQPELDKAMPYIQRARANVQDVIFHCMQSFRRAPVAAAAAYRRVTGGSATVRTFPME